MEKKKILVVDDDVDIVRILSINLRFEGFEVISAFDGATAVMQAHRHRPDLMLLDIMMPAGNGISVVERLRNSSRTDQIPIAFISALPREELRAKAEEAGIHHFFCKPFDISAIIWYLKKDLFPDESHLYPDEIHTRIAG
ncbi:MAG: response regulator [Actinomycetota bacterium]